MFKMTLNVAIGHWLNACARNAWMWSRYLDSWANWYWKM